MYKITEYIEKTYHVLATSEKEALSTYFENKGIVNVGMKARYVVEKIEDEPPVRSVRSMSEIRRLTAQGHPDYQKKDDTGEEAKPPEQV